MPRLMPVVRFVLSAWWLQFKQLSVGRLQLFAALAQPLVMATIAFLIFQHAQRETRQQVVLGAGLLGMWGATLFGSGAALSRQRSMGLLEGLVAAPPPLVLSVLPITVASATVGLYSMVATTVWCEALFEFSVPLHHPAVVLLCVGAAVITLGVTGLLISSVFFLYPAAQSLGNVIEFPVALLSGVLAPVSTLPSVVRPLSWVLAPTWSVRALQDAAAGGDAVAGPLAMSAALSAVYAVAAAVLLRILVDRARDKAKLALT